jgi:hypothetical protein
MTNDPPPTTSAYAGLATIEDLEGRILPGVQVLLHIAIAR